MEKLRFVVGDIVRIVSEQPDYNWNTYMDKYLGCDMTIKDIVYDDLLQTYAYRMEEDTYDSCSIHSDGGWYWFDDMIDDLVVKCDDNEMKDAIEDEELNSFLDCFCIK